MVYRPHHGRVPKPIGSHRSFCKCIGLRYSGQGCGGRAGLSSDTLGCVRIVASLMLKAIAMIGSGCGSGRSLEV